MSQLSCGHSLWSFSPGNCKSCKKAFDDLSKQLEKIDFSVLKDPKKMEELKKRYNSPEAVKARNERKLKFGKVGGFHGR